MSTRNSYLRHIGSHRRGVVVIAGLLLVAFLALALDYAVSRYRSTWEHQLTPLGTRWT